MSSSAKYYARNKDRICAQRRLRRRTNIAVAILQDSRKADKKRGYNNDLDADFIRELISDSCSYCGEDSIRRSLDRIRNNRGHTKDNVVVACERCNYARRDMPYEAWLVIAESMKKARVDGLFGSWTGGIHRRHKLDPLPCIPKKPLPPHGTVARYNKCRCDKCKMAMRDWKRESRRKKKKK